MSSKEEIDRLKLCVNEVFGYGSIPVSLCESEGIDPEAIAKDNGWYLTRGIQNHSFRKELKSKLDWSKNYTKKELQQIAKTYKK